MSQNHQCNFFQWVDPPVHARSRIVIVGLLRKIDRLEKEKNEAEKKKVNMTRMKWFIYFLVVVWCCCRMM